MSSGSRAGRMSAMVLSTTAAGTISQTARGFCSFFTRSASESDPMAFSAASSLTVVFDMSKTTHSCPPLRSRRTMLAPIRPRPTIPSCIGAPFQKASRGFPDQGSKIIGEKAADALDGEISSRQRGNDPGIVGVLTLKRQYRCDAVAPDCLYRGQNPRFVVDQNVMASRVALFDVLQLLFLVDV